MENEWFHPGQALAKETLKKCYPEFKKSCNWQVIAERDVFEHYTLTRDGFFPILIMVHLTKKEHHSWYMNIDVLTDIAHAKR